MVGSNFISAHHDDFDLVIISSILELPEIVLIDTILMGCHPPFLIDQEGKPCLPAEVLARKMLLFNADAVKALCELVSVISEATVQNILKICPSLSPQLAEQLVVTFQPWDGKIWGSGAP
jgi:hypothetical protein